jgi:DNA invertase Pin-like site-specific DNA recombinase
MAKAYHYIRFSNPDQKEGDSFDRQVKKAQDYCTKHGHTLVGRYFDEGVSGFTGANRKEGDLKNFIDAVNSGQIEPNSLLLIENMDRFSREDPLESLYVMKGIKEKGIKIIILDHDAEINLHSFHVFMPFLEAFRANQESERKSQLLGSAWAKKKTNALKKIITKRVPLWLIVVGEKDEQKFQVIPERKATVRRIFKLSAEGRGAIAIARILNKNEVPTFGKSKFWHVSYVKKILKNPATYGVYVPFKGRAKNRVQDGDPIEGYFPAVISKEEFCAAKTYRQDRERKGGRLASTGQNLFSSLMVCGTCGGKMSYANKGDGNVYYVCAKARLGGNCSYQSIRYRELEARILAKVPEMFGFQENEKEEAEDHHIAELRTKLLGVRAAIEKLIDMGEGGEGQIPELVERLKKRRKEEEQIHAEINQRIGLGERKRTEKANRSELKKNILEILEGDFEGIMASQDDSKRIRLKQHLAQSIKEIKIHFGYLNTGELAVWWPEILLRSGRVIVASRDPETEILFQKYLEENNLDENLEEKEVQVEAVH